MDEVNGIWARKRWLRGEKDGPTSIFHQSVVDQARSLLLGSGICQNRCPGGDVTVIFARLSKNCLQIFGEDI